MENENVPPPPPANNQHIKLPSIWCNNIISWFAMAEGQFVLRNVNNELIRYYIVLTALPEATINFVADFVEAPLPANPYTQLRARLLAAHQLTDYQKVEFIKKMPSRVLRSCLSCSQRYCESAPEVRRVTSSSST
jgi:hypothetical protein